MDYSAVEKALENKNFRVNRTIDTNTGISENVVYILGLRLIITSKVRMYLHKTFIAESSCGCVKDYCTKMGFTMQNGEKPTFKVRSKGVTYFKKGVIEVLKKYNHENNFVFSTILNQITVPTNCRPYFLSINNYLSLVLLDVPSWHDCFLIKSSLSYINTTPDSFESLLSDNYCMKQSKKEEEEEGEK